MTTSRDLLSRQKIVDVIQRLPENATIDDAIYRLNFLKAVAAGLRDVEEGRIKDHDEVFNELLREDAKNSNVLERSGRNGSSSAKAADRGDRATKRGQIRPKAKKSRK